MNIYARQSTFGSRCLVFICALIFALYCDIVILSFAVRTDYNNDKKTLYIYFSFNDNMFTKAAYRYQIGYRLAGFGFKNSLKEQFLVFLVVFFLYFLFYCYA